MKLFHRYFIKLSYRYYHLILNQDICQIPAEYSDKKNLFIYFDYEREFGNPNASVSDQQIHELLNIIKAHEIKTTWFSVGRLFDSYPESMFEILKNKHEIASHTYAHIAPARVSRKQLSKDFISFEQASLKLTEVKGFHSPNGLWSKNLLDNLIKHNYNYDLVGITKKIPVESQQLNIKDKNIIRLKTIGDDWPVYNKKYREKEVYEYFMQKLELINTCHPVGIGFHPWVLYSDPEILDAFKRFLDKVCSNSSYRIRRASDYADMLLDSKNHFS